MAAKADNRNLTIILGLTSKAASNAEVKAAITRAVTKWADIPLAKNKFGLTIPFQIYVDIDFDQVAFGRAFNNFNTIAITTFRETGLIPLNEFSTLFNGRGLANSRYQESLYDDLPTPVPTDLGEARVLTWAPVSDLSLGFDDGRRQPAYHTIALNSLRSFDFDPSDGIAPNKLDFEAIVLRELGRFMGFFSRVDTRSVEPPRENPFGGVLPTYVSLWDLYRFRPGATREEITLGTRILTPTGEQVFSTGDLEAPLAVTRFDPTLAPGQSYPFNQTASHWKDNALTGQYYGIMDESYAPGERGVLLHSI